MSKPDRYYTFSGRDLGWFFYSIFIATVDLCIGCVKGGNGNDGMCWFFLIIAAIAYASSALYIVTAFRLEKIRTHVASQNATVNNYNYSNYFAKQ